MGRPALALLVLVAAACASGHTGGSTLPVKVVAAENFWGGVIAQLGGPRVRVTSIITDAGTDPHLYESTPKDAAAVSNARLMVRNGAGYDDAIGKLATTSSARVLTISTALGVHGDDANPHLWYDVPRVPAVARAIVGELERIDPAGASTYQANLATFDASLQPLLDTIATIKARYARAPVAYTERVPEYLLDAAGLDVRTPSGFATAIEDGSEPTAGDQRAMNALVDAHAIKMLVYNAQATSPVTNRVRDRARRAGIPVVAVTETPPKSETNYQSWQLHQLQAILTALGG